VEPPPTDPLTVDGIRYRLAMPEPHTHLFHVQIEVGRVEGFVELAMPSWTPGSYLLREFPRNVQHFSACTADGTALAWFKRDKNTWRVEAHGVDVVVRYAVYANETTVRTSHLDGSHGYVNGASVFLWVEERQDEPIALSVDAPDGWRVTSSLDDLDGTNRFRASGYAHLIDSPIEIGTHEVLEFGACGIPHRYVVWGRGNPDAERLIADTRRIVEAGERFWGTLPYNRYTFFLHLLPGSRGGLEHRDSCSLHADPFAFRGAEYEQFLALVTHEFFHTWNGTRIRPEPLVGPDLRRENYTRNLWVVEGLTTYYTDLLFCRAGLITPDRYLQRFGEIVQRYRQLPGRHVQSLADSSFDTWIKFYRPDEHTPNSQVSYYQKGALVGLLLDMRIRRATANQRSLDDVMRLLWERFGSHDVGFAEETADGFQPVAEEICGEPLDDFFARYLFGLDELPLENALEVVGVRLDVSRCAEPADPAKPVNAAHRLGFLAEEQNGRTTITHVRTGSAAHRAGLNARDEVLAVDGFRTTPAETARRLALARHGERIAFGVARRGEWMEFDVVLDDEDVQPIRLVRVPDPSEEQAAAFAAWLGQEETT